MHASLPVLCLLRNERARTENVVPKVRSLLATRCLGEVVWTTSQILVESVRSDLPAAALVQRASAAVVLLIMIVPDTWR